MPLADALALFRRLGVNVEYMDHKDFTASLRGRAAADHDEIVGIALAHF